MIETRERTELSAPPAIRLEPPDRARGRTRGWWWLIAAAFAVAVIGGAIIAMTITGPTAPSASPVDRGHSRFHRLPDLDGSKVDLSDQAFRYGQVQLIQGSKVDLSDQAFRYGLVEPVNDDVILVPVTNPPLDRVKQDEIRREASSATLVRDDSPPAAPARPPAPQPLTLTSGPR